MQKTVFSALTLALVSQVVIAQEVQTGVTNAADKESSGIITQHILRPQHAATQFFWHSDNPSTFVGGTFGHNIGSAQRLLKVPEPTLPWQPFIQDTVLSPAQVENPTGTQVYQDEKGYSIKTGNWRLGSPTDSDRSHATFTQGAIFSITPGYASFGSLNTPPVVIINNVNGDITTAGVITAKEFRISTGPVVPPTTPPTAPNTGTKPDSGTNPPTNTPPIAIQPAPVAPSVPSENIATKSYADSIKRDLQAQIAQNDRKAQGYAASAGAGVLAVVSAPASGGLGAAIYTVNGQTAIGFAGRGYISDRVSVNATISKSPYDFSGGVGIGYKW